MNKVMICNLALSELGQRQQILHLEENTQAGRMSNLWYDKVREELLYGYRWNFAIKRVALALLVDAPVYGYTYQYSLPSDIVRVLEINDEALYEKIYKIEGEQLLTDEADVYLRYIYDVTDTTKFSKAFSTALVSGLGVKLAYNLSGSKTLRDRMERSHIELLKTLTSIDAIEDSVIVDESSNWINERLRHT